MIPDYQSIMLPFLATLSDGAEHSFADVVDRLASEFQLTEEEKKELLPSGTAFVFSNRAAWARTYLKKAGLIDAPRRGIITISERGRDVLKSKPTRIDVRFLRQYPEFLEFHSAKKDDTLPQEAKTDDPEARTPEETLDAAYLSIRESLASELMAKVLSMSPSFFEKLVVELLVKMGYGGSIKDAGRALGKTGDEGIDGTIKEDKLGLDIIYVQAKRWTPGNVVGRPEIQKFVGALAGQGAKKGIFITTSTFSKEATEYTPKNETKIVLIDGKQLSQLMIDYGLGVTTVNTYEIKRVDSDYFGEG